MMKPEDKKSKICVYCEDVFIPKQCTQIFCSSKCRTSHWRTKNPEKDKLSKQNYEKRCRAEEKKTPADQNSRLAVRRKNLLNRSHQKLHEVRSEIRNYKTKIGCQRCGYNEHYSALQFHHQPGFAKKFNVSNAKTIAQFYSEAKKCIILCANCHAIQNHKDMVSKAKKRKKKEA